MSLESKLRQLRKHLGQIERTPITPQELDTINHYIADLDGVLAVAEHTLEALGGRLESKGLDWENCDPSILDVRKCIAAVSTARGKMREELERVLKEKGVLQ